MRVIGMGPRGIGAVQRLVDGGALKEAEYWCLDTDPQILATASPLASRVLLGGALSTASERLQAAPEDLLLPADRERLLRAPERVRPAEPRRAIFIPRIPPERTNKKTFPFDSSSRIYDRIIITTCSPHTHTGPSGRPPQRARAAGHAALAHEPVRGDGLCHGGGG